MYLVAYRLINLLNDSGFTQAHIAESLLGIIKEIEHMPIDQVAEQMPHIKVHVVQVCKKTGV